MFEGGTQAGDIVPTFNMFNLVCVMHSLTLTSRGTCMPQ